MCRISKAKISIDSTYGTEESDSDSLRLVTIRGDPEQIELAKIMIHEKLIEAEERYHKDLQSNREKKKSDSAGSTGKLDSADIKRQLTLTAPPKDDQVGFFAITPLTLTLF